MADAESDIDCRVVCFLPPQWRQYDIREKILDSGEHIELVSIYYFLESLKISHVQALEMLYTSYAIINPLYQPLWDQVLAMREEIAFMNVDCWLKGLETQVEVSKQRFNNNETPDISQIAKFGYATKGPYHIARMDEMITHFLEGKDYSSIIRCSPERLIPIKRGFYSREEVEKTMLATIEQFQNKMATIPSMPPKFTTMYKMEKVFKEIIKKHEVQNKKGMI